MALCLTSGLLCLAHAPSQTVWQNAHHGAEREGAPYPPSSVITLLRTAPHRSAAHRTTLPRTPSSLLFLAPAHCAPREPELPPVDSHPPTFGLAPSSPHSFPCADLPTLPTFRSGRRPPTLSLSSLLTSPTYLSLFPSLSCQFPTEISSRDNLIHPIEPSGAPSHNVHPQEKARRGGGACLPSR